MMHQLLREKLVEDFWQVLNGMDKGSVSPAACPDEPCVRVGSGRAARLAMYDIRPIARGLSCTLLTHPGIKHFQIDVCDYSSAVAAKDLLRKNLGNILAGERQED